MRPGLLTRLLFVSYCLEAGMFLLMVPWSPAWDRTVARLPFPLLAAMLQATFGRAALAGFGMVHLIWGIHDLDSLWPRRGKSSTPAAPTPRAALPSNPGDPETPGAASSGV